MKNLIKTFVLEALMESNDSDKEKKQKNLLTEPDSEESEENLKAKKSKRKKDESSGGGVAGAMVPLGADSASYPDSRVGKTKKHKH